MNLKSFSAALFAALFLMQAFTPTVQATNNECTQECPHHRGEGRR